MIDDAVIESYMRYANPIPNVDDVDADEFARFVAAAHTKRANLAEREAPRGATAALEDAHAEAAAASRLGRPGGRRGLLVAAGSAAAVLVLVGATILVVRPFAGEETAPATSGVPVVPANRVSGVLGPMNGVNDVAFAPDGHLWAATSGGLVQWDTETGDFVLFTQQDGVPGRHVNRVEVAPDGTVWTVGSSWIGRFDGSWQVFTADNTPQLNGQLGDLAVDHEGVVWAGVASEPLARYDGSWSAVEPPRDGGRAVSPNGLAVGPDGTLWVGTHDSGVFAFDGSTWRHYTEDDGAPARAWNVVAAADGTVWAWGDGYYTDPELTDYVPATGFARYDGSTWSTFTVDDGLLSNDGSVVTALDGTAWVVHSDFGENAESFNVSRFDGSAWSKYAEVGRADDGPSGVIGVDGLWLVSGSGIIGFDGADTIRLVVPEELATPSVPPFTMTLVPDQTPVRVSTAIGIFEFTEMGESPRRDIFAVAATPYGPVIPNGDVLLWSTDYVNWQGMYADADYRWITTDGADVVLFDQGLVRYSWDGSGWAEAEAVDLPGSVQDIAFGPNGAVALVDNEVYHSTDGVNFVRAEPGPTTVESSNGLGGACSIAGASVSVAGDGNGPILVTDAGYVVLAPPNGDWNQTPLCEPLLWFSEDGSSWELMTPQSPFGLGAGIRDVAAHDGRFVAIGGTGERGGVWVSDDGIDWQRSNIELDAALAIAGGDLGWFLTGETGLSGMAGGDMWFSSDGLNWDGPYESPAGLGFFYFRTEPSVGPDAIFSINGTHDGLVIGRLQE